MAKLNTAKIKHFIRPEETEIFDFLSGECNRIQLTLIGESGVGKTQLIHSLSEFLNTSPRYEDYTIMHFDAKVINQDSSSDLLYNILIAKLLQQCTYSDIDHNKVEASHAFLKFLDKKDYKDDIKHNIKRSLIASLTLLPQIGSLAALLFDAPLTSENTAKYNSNELFFNEYIRFLAEKTGLIIILDNIQNINDQTLQQLNQYISKVNGQLIYITSRTIEKNTQMHLQQLQNETVLIENLTIHLENINLNEFKIFCEDNFSYNISHKLIERLDFYYRITQNGNLRQINELYFRINNFGLDKINGIPTEQSVDSLEDLQKDILNLASIFPEGIRLSYIKKIIGSKDNMEYVDKNIYELENMHYIVNEVEDIYRVEHQKISEASRQLLQGDKEEERFTELIYRCERVLTEDVYHDINDADFIFCIDGILGLTRQFNFVIHIGILSKYFRILYAGFHYMQICNIFNHLLESAKDSSEIIAVFPLNTLKIILDAHQKTSQFENGLKIAESLNFLNSMQIYNAKFLLQTYKYVKAVELIELSLNSYQGWSIYLNALQHMRKDDEVKTYVETLIKDKSQYSDMEYYYIILRNSGHLFDIKKGIDHLNESLAYFTNEGNEFAEATCMNNLGILYLYQYRTKKDMSLSLALEQFNKARKLLSEIGSNEVYQSLFNIGLVKCLQGDYINALDYFTRARKIAPTNLSFDHYKFQCDEILCELLNTPNMLAKCIELLNDLLLDIEDLPDPWLKFQYRYNLHVLQSLNGYDTSSQLDQLIKDYVGNPNVYGLYHDTIINAKEITLLLGVSPHWRY